MSRQFWAETIAWATADGTAVNTTTTETIIFPNVTIPANYMQDGRTLLLSASGRWSSLTGTSPTYTWAIRWGGVSGTILAQSGAITASTTATTNGQWEMQIRLQTRSNGATGTIFTQGTIMLANSTAAGKKNSTKKP